MLKVFDGRVTLDYALQISQQRGREIPQSVLTEPSQPVPKEIVDSQNQELLIYFQDWIKILQLNQLEPETLTEENKALAWDIVRRLVKMLNGHPDAQRVIEDYPNLLRKLTRLQERSTLD
jgi:hypothetical protein